MWGSGLSPCCSLGELFCCLKISLQRTRLPQTAFLPFGQAVLPRITDSIWGENDQYIRLDAQCENRPLSLGINNQPGWAAYVLGENTLLQRYVHSEGVWYPNHGCSFRASITGNCLQLETFSPLYNGWNRGNTIRHAENYSCFRRLKTPASPMRRKSMVSGKSEIEPCIAIKVPAPFEPVWGLSSFRTFQLMLSLTARSPMARSAAGAFE